MKLKIKLMIPVIVLFLLTILTLAYLTEIRETTHHMDRELEAWIDVGQSIVSAWSTTMILTGSDNLARDQLHQQDNKNILSSGLVRNPKMKRINAQSSPFASTDLELEVIKNGRPISNIVQSDKTRSLLTLVPIVARHQCAECHRTQNQHEIEIGDVMGVVTLKTSLELVDVLIASDRNSVLFGLAAALLIGVFFIYYSTNRIIKPIQILTALSKKVTSENLDVRSEIAADDEIGVLSQAFNEMTAKLSVSRVELENYAARLETEIAAKAEEIRQSETTFRRLTEKTAKTTGREFFESLVLSISDWLGCKWGLLGEVISDEDVNVIARCENGKILETIRFSIKGTPCEDLNDGSFRYHAHVREDFPFDDLLKEMNAETYIGIPFYSSTGEPIGILIAFHDSLLKPPSYTADVFKVFAERAAAELERQRIEEEKNWLTDRLKEAERERAKRTLREGETRYQNLVETTSDWIWEVDVNSKYTYVSPKVFDLIGYDPEEVIGRMPFDFMPEQEARRVKEIFQTIVDSGASIERLKNTRIHKNGSPVILETSGVPVLDENGNLLGYRGIDRDITERVKSEEQIHRLSSAVEQSPSSVLITDIKGTIIYVNKKFSEVTGYAPGEVMGKKASILKSGEHPPEFYDDLWETITAGNEWRGEFHNRKKDGKLFWESALISPIQDSKGKITHYIALKEDLTERRKMEKDILHSHSQLRELSLRLQNLLEEERARIARELHDELGSSLTSVKLDISWLKNEVSQDQQLSLFDKVARKLDSIIQSMRRIASELRPGILDAVGIAAAIEWQLEEFEEHSGIACKLKLPEEDLALDKDQSTAIFRILQESLTNIIRHADASEVNVTITQSATQVVLEVTDNGKGITQARLKNQKSLGILGMRERILPWGGELFIQANGAVTGGTTVKVVLPLVNKVIT